MYELIYSIWREVSWLSNFRGSEFGLFGCDPGVHLVAALIFLRTWIRRRGLLRLKYFLGPLWKGSWRWGCWNLFIAYS